MMSRPAKKVARKRLAAKGELLLLGVRRVPRPRTKSRSKLDEQEWDGHLATNDEGRNQCQSSRKMGGARRRGTHKCDGDRSENGRSDSGVEVLVKMRGWVSRLSQASRTTRDRPGTHLKHLRSEHGETEGERTSPMSVVRLWCKKEGEGRTHPVPKALRQTVFPARADAAANR